jgi:cytochrome P450
VSELANLDTETKTWATSSFDPWDPRLNRSNIWSIYRSLRETGRVVYSEAHGGLWLITRYHDIRASARDTPTFSSALGVGIGKPARNPRAIPLETDPPEHARFRMPMYAPFSPKRIGELEQMVRGHVADIVVEVGEHDVVEIVEQLAQEVPFRVISDVIGFDAEARARNRDLSLAVVNEKYTPS